MKLILATILPTLIGMVVIINGQIIKVDDIVASAWTAHHQVNRHEVRTAMELYYDDFESYPSAQNAEELFLNLYNNGYISSLPPKPEAYEYRLLNSNNYEFKIK